MAVNKEDLYRLIEQITDPIELETAYRAIDSIVKHDDQSWYWTEHWHQGELEAEQDKQAGRVSRKFGSARELFAHLDRISSQEGKTDEN